MPAPTITALPDAPLRSEDPATFNSKAEAFVDAFEALPTEVNAFGSYLNGLALSGVSGSITATALTMATARILGRSTASTGAIEELSLGSGLSLVAGVLSATGYASGGTDVAVADGGTGASTASGARTNLGLVIGTDIPARSPSIQSVTSSATVTPTFADDQVNITAQAAALALANWTGTAVDGWGIAIRIKDNGTARAITYDTQYRAIGVTLPTTTVASKVLYLGGVWNAAASKIDIVAVAQEV